jgi:Zn-dependent protease
VQINDVQYIWMTLFALIIAIPIHEFAHALSAVNNGDDGPRRDNRLTIFPWDHFDPVGAVAVVISTVLGFGLGWGRPVLVNPGALRNPKWDMCKIAAWGPLSNLLLAIAAAVPLRFGWIPAADEGFFQLFFHFIQVNLGLMLFNLIPIGPLDGAKILVAFLPDQQAHAFSRFMEQFGMLLLLLLITAGGGLMSLLIGVPMVQLMGWLLGPRFSFG